MAKHDLTLSRRAILATIAVSPTAALSVPKRTEQKGSADFKLEIAPQLNRSLEGRRASRFRYHNAEGFFRGIDHGIVSNAGEQLYQTGVVLQLGLSSHLFDVGFTDEWCVRHIGLYVVRSLAYANATGFGFACAEFDLLAAILSPYSRWRLAESSKRVGELPFTAEQMRTLTRSLLDHVHQVTGHPRPRGWSARHD